MRRCREELGRAADPFITGMLLPVHIDRSPRARAAAAQAWAGLTGAGAPLPERLFVAGRPDHIVEHLHRYWEAGCTEFVLGPAEQGEGYLAQVEQLGREVLPDLKAFA